MRKPGFWLFVLLMLATVLTTSFGLSMLAQSEANLLLFSHYEQETASRSLYLLDADTGEERLITTAFSDAGWSPDGRIWAIDDNAMQRRLRFFDAATGEESIFEHSLYANGCDAGVYWSPDGEQMAYVINAGESFFLNLQTLRDESRYQIPVQAYEIPFWSPNSEYLFVGSSNAAVPSSLFSADDGARLAEPQRFISFSPDSRYLSYFDDANNLHLFDTASGEVLRLDDSDFGYWSGSGRYFLTSLYPYSESLSYYDLQNDSFQSIDLGFELNFAGWAADESAIFLYADYLEYEGIARPRQVLRYELASRSSSVILEAEGWVQGIYRNGDWYAFGYSSTPPENLYGATNQMLFSDGTTRLELDLPLADLGWFWSNVSPVADAGFAFYTEDGLYYFDFATQELELIYSDNSYQFVSPGGDYIAFLSPDEEAAYRLLRVWNRDSREIRIAQQEASTILGWQGSIIRESLLYCGEG